MDFIKAYFVSAGSVIGVCLAFVAFNCIFVAIRELRLKLED